MFIISQTTHITKYYRPFWAFCQLCVGHNLWCVIPASEPESRMTLLPGSRIFFAAHDVRLHKKFRDDISVKGHP